MPYSLYLEGNAKEALKLLEGLKKEELEEPSIAAYYGIILAGGRRPCPGQALPATRGWRQNFFQKKRVSSAKPGGECDVPLMVAAQGGNSYIRAPDRVSRRAFPVKPHQSNRAGSLRFCLILGAET